MRTVIYLITSLTVDRYRTEVKQNNTHIYRRSTVDNNLERVTIAVARPVKVVATHTDRAVARSPHLRESSCLSSLKSSGNQSSCRKEQTFQVPTLTFYHLCHPRRRCPINCGPAAGPIIHLTGSRGLCPTSLTSGSWPLGRGWTGNPVPNPNPSGC